jgi:hypothetical protein
LAHLFSSQGKEGKLEENTGKKKTKFNTKNKKTKTHA